MRIEKLVQDTRRIDADLAATKLEHAQGVEALMEKLAAASAEDSMRVEQNMEGKLVGLQGSIQTIESQLRLCKELAQNAASGDMVTQCQELANDVCRKTMMEQSDCMTQGFINVNEALADLDVRSKQNHEDLSAELRAQISEVVSRTDAPVSNDLSMTQFVPAQKEAVSQGSDVGLVLKKLEEQTNTHTKDLTDLGELVLGEIAELRTQTEEKWVTFQKDLEIERQTRGVDSAANQSAVAAITRRLTKSESFRSPTRAPAGFSSPTPGLANSDSTRTLASFSP